MTQSQRETRRQRIRGQLGQVATGIATTAATLATYRFVIQPWHQTWGATKAEVEKSLPGDGLVPAPSYTTTRAITINASPEDVWPWLAQMGQGRGGFYSYAWLENLFGLDIHNADHVVSDWQDLEPGDTVRLAPSDQYEGRAKMRVVHLEPHRAIVFGPAVDTAAEFEDASRTGAGTWAFVLESMEEGAKTRLLVRTRSRPWKAPRSVFYLYDPAHFIMERRMLLGIKRRAEMKTRRRTVGPSGDGERVPEPA
ncbi:MAG TPA: hypothetical protein VJ884_07665 [Salinibacter sp.]|nr:hypothetical protein [Salinibacter sp.]